MNKKGQFYIFTAIILSGIAFSLIQTGTTFQDSNPVFSELTQNLMHESRVVINQAIYNEEDVNSTYDAFFKSFMAFAKTKDPKFQAVYLLKFEDDVYVYNDIHDNVVVSHPTTTIARYSLKPIESSSILSTGNQLTIRSDDVDYMFSFDFASEDPELMALVRSERQGERRIKKIEIR